MTKPRFVIKGIDQRGHEVVASAKQFSSVYRAELETLEFYGDPRFKIVWVELQGYGHTPSPQGSDRAAG